MPETEVQPPAAEAPEVYQLCPKRYVTLPRCPRLKAALVTDITGIDAVFSDIFRLPVSGACRYLAGSFDRTLLSPIRSGEGFTGSPRRKRKARTPIVQRPFDRAISMSLLLFLVIPLVGCVIAGCMPAYA
ncbi:hypothetical protein ACTZWW_20335, partial [Salinarimonas sp. NSM]|uniref:hypothetical protein n=1 Tax=Salinarimonas sp. NSM TaxID=3458003 RepID=UPI004035547F